MAAPTSATPPTSKPLRVTAQRLCPAPARPTSQATITGSLRARSTSTPAKIATTAGTEYHYVLTFQSGIGAFASTGGRASWYRNGTLIASLDTSFRLNQIEDVNNWLGRSHWSGDRNTHAALPAEQAAAFVQQPAQQLKGIDSPVELYASQLSGR